MGNLMLNLDDYVRVTQTTGTEIMGRYDGVDYTFPHDEPVDVHKAVATHIFGFGLPEVSDSPSVQDKTPALLRLGWVTHSGDKKSGLVTLRERVRFEEIPPFPTVLRLRQPEENSGLLQQDSESASRVPSSPPLGGGAASTVAAPTDHTLHIPKAAKR